MNIKRDGLHEFVNLACCGGVKWFDVSAMIVEWLRCHYAIMIDGFYCDGLFSGGRMFVGVLGAFTFYLNLCDIKLR